MTQARKIWLITRATLLLGFAPALARAQYADAPLHGAAPAGAKGSVAQLMVTNSSDNASIPAVGSLRFALLAANGDNSANRIVFNIPGACPRVIDLAAPLPDVQGVISIDGFSQPGSAENTQAYTGLSADIDAVQCVAIRGGGNLAHALQVPNNGSGTLSVKGLALGGFTTAAIRLTGGTGHLIQGNQFGGSLGNGALNLGTNTAHLRIGGSSNAIQIGGDFAAARNLFAGASGNAIEILPSTPNSSTNNVIEGNLIGTTPSSLNADGNFNGIVLKTSGNEIRHNVISGNLNDGLVLQGGESVGNIVESNKIGLTGTLNVFGNDLPNGRHGVFVDDSASANLIRSNAISYNGEAGIRVGSGQENELDGNTIGHNGALGIDTANAGGNPIDNDASATAQAQANRGLNQPVLQSIGFNALNQLGVLTELSSTNGTYDVRFFISASCDPSGRGEGESVHSSMFPAVSINNAVSGGNGSVQFTKVLSGTPLDLDRKWVSAVATDALGNSSEFSNCLQIPVCRDIFADGMEDQDVPRYCAP